MLASIINGIFWIYWWLNRPFLRAFSVTLIGHSDNELNPSGRQIVDKVQSLLWLMPRPVFAQAIAAIFLLPMWVPRRWPEKAWQRFFVWLWSVIASQFARLTFLLKSQAARSRMVDQIFHRLNSQAALEENELFKSIIMLSMVKTILTSAYLDLDRTWSGLGYKPYTQRTWNPPTGPDLAHPPETPKSRLLMDKAIHDVREIARKPAGVTTYLVIGSGAGGAVAAYYIKKLDPKARIVILDSGSLVPNNELPVHLMTAAATLYMNGAVTLSANEKYTFIQARCVGGGPLMNNSVSFKPEGIWWDDWIVKRWSWLGAKLDFPRLSRSYDELFELLHVVPIPERVMPPMAQVLRDGFAAIGMTPKVTTANILECIGCGRCNAGCQYAAKQSMNVTLLPDVVADGGLLVPNAHVTKLALEGPLGRQICRGAHVRTRHGEVLVEADKVVLAAGALASTKILRRSGFTGANVGVRTVGRRFSGNMGTPLFGEFPQLLLGWRGLQVAYYIEMPTERVVIETGFGPPPAFGLQAPQWGQDFMDGLKAYDHVGVAVPVFGTDAYGDITRDLAAPSGYAIRFELIDQDWYRLQVGLKRCAEAMFAAGARKIYSTRFDAAAITKPEQIDDYFATTGPLQYLKITTAHLQGGNVINSNSNAGVVDTNMKVHGIDRLWITDASVIPSPTTLNVQMTVMALAHYAAPGIAAA